METVHPLKAYREREQITQMQLAERLGVARETIARWESGSRKVNDALVGPVSGVTGIPSRELRPDLAAMFPSEAAE